jgi:hypothetical protein
MECNMMISLRLNDEDSALFKKYAEMKDVSLSELLRRSVLDRIEEEYDLKAYAKAMAEYRADPVVHTLDEVERELGLK